MRIGLVFAGVLALPLAGGPGARAHHLDAENTHLSFDIERLGLRWFTADFRDLSGDFALERNGRDGSLTVVVRTASVDARSSYWNARLRSPQWLDTERFPEMVFRSTGITLAGAAATVAGELTLHGVTRPLVLSVTDIDCPAAAGRSCRFLGRATLRRSEFGIPHGFWLGGDQVEIVVRGD